LIHIVSTFYEIAVDASASTPRDNKIPLSWLNRLNRLLRETHIKLVDRPTMSLTIRPNPVLVGPGYGVEYIKQGHVAQSPGGFGAEDGPWVMLPSPGPSAL